MNAVELSHEMAEVLKKEPKYFADILRLYSDVEYRTVLLGWSELRSAVELKRDEEGRYLIA